MLHFYDRPGILFLQWRGTIDMLVVLSSRAAESGVVIYIVHGLLRRYTSRNDG